MRISTTGRLRSPAAAADRGAAVRTVRELRSTLPQRGRVERILVRPARHAPTVDLTAVAALAGLGLDGDRRAARGRTGSPRQVTLVQAEHLDVIAALLGRSEPVDASVLRRNLVVSGVPVLALKGLRFRVGEALLEGTGPCHPCSRMEDALGEGGYQAMRGHGGITAAVIEAGSIDRGAVVRLAV